MAWHHETWSIVIVNSGLVGTSNGQFCVFTSETKTYRLFIWLDEKGEANDVEQGAVFNGTVHVDVVGAGQGITGDASSSQ